MSVSVYLRDVGLKPSRRLLSDKVKTRCCSEFQLFLLRRDDAVYIFSVYAGGIKTLRVREEKEDAGTTTSWLRRRLTL